MNRLILLFLIVLSTSLSLESQIYDPVDWSWKTVELDNGEFDLVFTAEIEDHWHVYSAYLDTTKIGPVPTSVTLESSSKFVNRGAVKEGKPLKQYDPNFEMELKYFDHKAEWRQRVKWTDPNPGVIGGYISFMTCNDEMCLPPEDIDFELTITPTKKSSSNKSIETKSIGQESSPPSLITDFTSASSNALIDDQTLNSGSWNLWTGHGKQNVSMRMSSF